MDYKERFNLWLNDEFFDEETREELKELTDEREIVDRFYRDLGFGTGGLRGIMGAGTNRINKYTIGKATTGLGKYLIDTYGEKRCIEQGVVVGYDTRNNSKDFAQITSNVLSGLGIKVFLHSAARPTPQLSFSVQRLNCLAGIVITASHNPKKYNGYKVYDEFGCQLVPVQSKRVIKYIDTISDYREIRFAGQESLINSIDVTGNFVDAVLKQTRNSDIISKANFKIVYTSLHGTGRVPVLQVLKKAGFTNVNGVREQMDEDGNFPTVISPNPENGQALELGIRQAKVVDADIVLGTDPDSDRVGIAVKTGDGYQLMTGNQIGALLIEYLLNKTNLTEYKNPAVIKTIVTSELGAEIAYKRGVKVFSTLTGFKYIGEKITQFEQAYKDGTLDQRYEFLFGYEESYGFLAGTHARDKDAVVSTLLICEMAAEYKRQGKTLFDQMNEIYAEFGVYRDAMDSFTLEGKEGLQKIRLMMKRLRGSVSPFSNTEQIIDYSISVRAEEGFGRLPKSDVMKYVLRDGSWIAVRPSGTEPKIKIYYSVKGASKELANKSLKVLQTTIRKELGLN